MQRSVGLAYAMKQVSWLAIKLRECTMLNIHAHAQLCKGAPGHLNMAEPGKQPEPVPSNTPSLSYKSASEIILQEEEDNLSSSQRSGSPATTTTTTTAGDADTTTTKCSPTPRHRSRVMTSKQRPSEEAITVGGGSGDGGMMGMGSVGEDLSSSSGRGTPVGKGVGTSGGGAIRVPAAPQAVVVMNGECM